MHSQGSGRVDPLGQQQNDGNGLKLNRPQFGWELPKSPSAREIPNGLFQGGRRGIGVSNWARGRTSKKAVVTPPRESGPSDSEKEPPYLGSPAGGGRDRPKAPKAGSGEEKTQRSPRSKTGTINRGTRGPSTAANGEEEAQVGVLPLREKKKKRSTAILPRGKSTPVDGQGKGHAKKELRGITAEKQGGRNRTSPKKQRPAPGSTAPKHVPQVERKDLPQPWVFPGPSAISSSKKFTTFRKGLEDRSPSIPANRNRKRTKIRGRNTQQSTELRKKKHVQLCSKGKVRLLPRSSPREPGTNGTFPSVHPLILDCAPPHNPRA